MGALNDSYVGSESGISPQEIAAYYQNANNTK
jgi:hypothetical protein